MYWDSRYEGDMGCLGELGDRILTEAELRPRAP